MPTADLANVILCSAVTLEIGKHILVVPLGKAVTLLKVDQHYILVVKNMLIDIQDAIRGFDTLQHFASRDQYLDPPTLPLELPQPSVRSRDQYRRSMCSFLGDCGDPGLDILVQPCSWLLGFYRPFDLHPQP